VIILLSQFVIYKIFWLNNAVNSGVAGFEPANHRVRACCLTAWLHPIGL
ncbi:uncharacterized protein METZ01_LOCUS259222, partial [marine metagenome]